MYGIVRIKFCVLFKITSHIQGFPIYTNLQSIVPANLHRIWNRPAHHQSKMIRKSVPFKDDPLFSNLYELDLVECGRPPVHTPEMTGLIAVLDREYNLISVSNYNFHRVITIGMYRYFGAMIVWARLLKVHMMNQYSYDQQMKRFVEVVQRGNFTVPPLLQIYINALGNMKLPSGRVIRLKLPDLHLCKAESGHGGYFGKIEEHAELYAQLISPGVLIDKIMNDLGTPGDWDLPRDIRMKNHSINENCLGYGPARIIHPTVLKTYADLQITNDSFPTEFPEFCYNPDLMSIVMNNLRASKGLKLKEINLQTPYGSIGQLMTAVYTRSEYDQTNLQDVHRWKGVCPIRIPEQISKISLVFLYRREFEKNHLLMPNDFESDSKIPKEYFKQFERFHAKDDPIIGLQEFKGIEVMPISEMWELSCILHDIK